MSDTTTKAKVPVTKGAKSPTAKKADVVTTRSPVGWVGIDRHSLPINPANNEPGWLGSLMDRSNLRFTGAYIQGAPLIELFGNPLHLSSADDFKSESLFNTNRKWMQNIGHLRDQGWGIVFWYFGLSNYKKETNWPSAIVDMTDVAVAGVYGRLHARHAKTAIQTTIQTTNTDLAGSVVFLDNEDGRGTPTPYIKAYCEAFFDELEKPGPGTAPAMRCGLYAQSKFADKFVEKRRDLFVWEIRLDTATDDSGLTAMAPFEFAATLTSIFVDPAWTQNPTPNGRGERAIHSFEVKTAPTEKWTGWPVGRQFRFYSGQMPVAGSGAVDAPSHFTRMGVFDYDSSLVRDPSYPVAEPRIAATTNSIVVAGSFQARTAGGTNPPSMKIESIEGTGRNPVPAVALVEPDAPIAVAAFPGADTHYVTVRDDTCDLVAFKRDLNGVWSAIDVIIFMNGPVLRRLRAIALVAYDANDLHLLFAGDDHQLYTSRSQSPGVWDAPAVVGDLPALHPFTSMIAASRSGQSVDIFALDDQGLLSTWSWLATQGTWQKATLDATVPQAVPSLLKASALAAASPDAQKLFVLGVRKDLRLAYWEWTGPDGGWSKQKAPIEWSSRLSPHTRLAVHSYPGFVEAAGLNHEGTLRLYSLELTGTTWIARSPIKYDDPDNAPPAGYVPPPPTSLTEQAYGWKLNPYGDLAIAREATGTIVHAAGIAPGRTGLLRLNVTIEGSTWELLR